jgi:outer membrane receptor protein involved in Fe transport
MAHSLLAEHFVRTNPTHMIKPHLTLRLLALMVTTGSVQYVAAQTAPTASAAPAEEVVTLEKLDVSGVPIEKSILPTSRPFSSVYGTDQNITEIPRNVTIISREQLNTIGVRDVRDFSKLTSSSYTKTNFGAPSNPDLRGAPSDVFQNGVRERTTSNGNGMPIDFNAIESINIVKGAATAVQGSSQYVGGFVDLVTKRPTFDSQKTVLSATIGSNDIYRWTADYNTPVNDKLAVRVSYSGEDSQGFYESEYRKTQSVYGAATYKPSDSYELFANASFTYMEYTENWGINRPTQNLIDHHLYLTGVNNNGGSVATVDDPQNATNVLAPFPGNTVAWGPEVKIDRDIRTLKPGDNSLAKNIKLQAIQTFTATPDRKLVNNNLFTYTQRETLSSYYYSEVVDPSITLQSRWEYQMAFTDTHVNAGVDARYISVKAYSDYGFEPAGVWDLTKPRSGINIYKSTAFIDSINSGPFGRVPVPGYKNRYYGANTFSSDSNESHSFAAAPFVQADHALTDKLTVLGGARADFLHVNATEPFSGANDQVDVVLPNVNGSLVYKITDKASAYGTYNYSENTAGAEGNGGGYLLTNTNGSPFAVDIDKDSYSTPAELWEAGMKFSLIDKKLFLGTALFDQRFTRKSQGSPATEYNYKGFEVELNYQPSKNFFATFGYSVIDGQVAASGFESISTNIGTVAPEIKAAYANNIRVQGLPKNLFNALASYTFDNGFGASLGAVVHSEINNNWAGTVVIPWQYELNTSVFYTYKNWNARLAIFNLTDAWNWAPNNGIYGNESILLQPGIRGELTLGYKF